MQYNHQEGKQKEKIFFEVKFPSEETKLQSQSDCVASLTHDSYAFGRFISVISLGLCGHTVALCFLGLCFYHYPPPNASWKMAF